MVLLPPTPLEAEARRLRLTMATYAPDRVDELRKSMREARTDLIAVASFPAILPTKLLEIPGINLHQLLLPCHRGIDPLFWTYHAYDRETGTTVHWLDGGVDRGDILSQRVMPLARGNPMLSLYDDLSRAGSVQLAEAIDAIESGITGNASYQFTDIDQYVWRLRALRVQRKGRQLRPAEVDRWTPAYFYGLVSLILGECKTSERRFVSKDFKQATLRLRCVEGSI